MGLSDKKLSGQKLDLRATDWNDVLQAAQDTRAAANTFEEESFGSARPIVVGKVLNSTGDVIPTYSAVALREPIVSPDDNLEEFQREPSFEAFVPEADDVEPPTVAGVMMEPLADGEIGEVCLAGVMPTQINIVTEGDPFCDLDEGELNFKSGPFGGQRILWADAGTGLQWCLVMLGSGQPENAVIEQTRIGKTTQDIAPIDGDTPGVGSVDLYEIDVTDDAVTIAESATGYSFCSQTIPTGTWVKLIREAGSGKWIVIPPDAIETYIGKANGIITALSGSTPGTGEVDLYKLVGTSLVATGETITVYSLYTDEIDDDTWVSLVREPESREFFAIPAESGSSVDQTYIAQADGVITARSGATPGTGTAAIYKLVAGDLEATGDSKAIYSLSSHEIPDEAWLVLVMEPTSGDFFAIDPDPDQWTYIGKTTTDITALAGSVPGSGTVELYKLDAGHVVTQSASKTVYSYRLDVVPDDTWVALVREAESGEFFVLAERSFADASEIQPVGEDADAGTSELVARADHIHALDDISWPIMISTGGSLTVETGGDITFDYGSTLNLYGLVTVNNTAIVNFNAGATLNIAGNLTIANTANFVVNAPIIFNAAPQFNFPANFAGGMTGGPNPWESFRQIDRWHSSPSGHAPAVSAQTVSPNKLWAAPYITPSAGTISSMRVIIGTGGGAGEKFRLGIYVRRSLGANGIGDVTPWFLVAVSAEVALDATGAAVGTISYTTKPGELIWLVYLGSDGADLDCVLASDHPIPLGRADDPTDGWAGPVDASYAYGLMPIFFPAATYTAPSVYVPLIEVKYGVPAVAVVPPAVMAGIGAVVGQPMALQGVTGGATVPMARISSTFSTLATVTSGGATASPSALTATWSQIDPVVTGTSGFCSGGIFGDQFTDTDGTVLASHSPTGGSGSWLTYDVSGQSEWQIQSDHLSAGSTNQNITCLVDVGTGDVDVSVDFVVPSSGWNFAILLRSTNSVSAGIPSQFLYCYLNINATSGITSAGIAVNAGAGPVVHPTVAAGAHTLRAVANGSALELFLDGVSLTTHTSSSGSGNTYVGLITYAWVSNADFSNGTVFDNFCVKNS